MSSLDLGNNLYGSLQSMSWPVILFMYDFSTPVIINMCDMNGNVCYVLDVELVISIFHRHSLLGDVHQSEVYVLHQRSKGRYVKQQEKHRGVTARRDNGEERQNKY